MKWYSNRKAEGKLSQAYSQDGTAPLLHSLRREPCSSLNYVYGHDDKSELYYCLMDGITAHER